ncbi:MAG TPA: DUF4249 domain-containing protein [Ruminiclostridium sp.]|nr:DUF4249 domain-containing protein [Ruminiclostridium sp.]
MFIITAVFVLTTCIDPYTPELKGYESLLVIDGLVTNDNSSYTVKLSRTVQAQNAEPEKVSDATVYVTDNEGLRSEFTRKGNGIYKTDSTVFSGKIGKYYTLHVLTSDGKEYQSDPCVMEPVPSIDSLYWEKSSQLMNNGTENIEGIQVYLDSKAGTNSYFRWDFTETWIFKVPDPAKFKYINDTIILPLDRIREYCWKYRNSDEVLIKTVKSENAEKVSRLPIYFIATGKSDRLLLQYDITVKQYSISEAEYEFWNNLQKVNESGSDIFASQPFPVISNIHNVTDPNEMVLGYFKVSAVSERRKEIMFTEAAVLGLPFYKYPCVRIEMSPSKFPASGSFSKPPTWNEIYEMYCVTRNFAFVEPIYNDDKKLKYLVFTTKECANCELTGTSTKPSFWKSRI